ncbi:hypothetical protein CERSUDRAFT_125861 [Gelatoporia subvermispora B]|uniref:BTB domain-containing protein n=1 Tax=Ceriporiopsis subvermispora (strain B) TaxID=914234 RepID=M2PCV4_CERS8|nr:hypothetical protein CERSUDRAFT_125861 [Gelatoporia subvermispora B]
MASTPNFAHPFTKPSADVIIRSCDDVDFRVPRTILAEASPVFEGMFSLPQAAELGLHAEDLPVVDMSESAKVLNALLQLCYPMTALARDEFDHFVAVLEAALKYDMQGASGRLRPDLAKRWAVRYPLEAFEVVCKLHLRQEAKELAELSLQEDIFGENGKVSSYISPENLYRLLAYQSQCVKTALSFILYQEVVMLQPGSPDPKHWYMNWLLAGYECECCVYAPISLRQDEFCKALLLELTKRPCGYTVKNLQARVRILDDVICAECRESAPHKLDDSILPRLASALDHHLNLYQSHYMT